MLFPLRRCVPLVLFFAAVAHSGPTLDLRKGLPTVTDSLPVLPGMLPSEPGTFRFAIIGDKTGGPRDEWEIFDRAVDDINLLRPDFALMIGDQIHGYTDDAGQIDDEWATFLEHAGRLDVPLFLVPGNHDVTTPEMVEDWEQRHGATYYSFDYREAHFLVLNTEEERSGSMTFGDEQIEFILRDLARSRDARHTFLFMHRPAWRNCMRPPDMDLADGWAQISGALGDRPWTVFSGHRHWLMYEVRGGHRHFVLGPTGGNLGSPGVREYGKLHHWTLVTVQPDTVHVAIVEPGGPVWPQDVATGEFICAAKKVVELRSEPPVREDRSTWRIAFTGEVHNTLADTADVRIVIRGRGWPKITGPTDTTLNRIPPGGRAAVSYRFDVPAAQIPERPEWRFHATILAGTISSRWDELPFAPDAMIETIPRWIIAGPFPWDDARASSCDARFTRAAEAWSDGRLWFTQLLGSADSTTGFARATIHSGHSQTVWAEYWITDRGEVSINGRVVPESQVAGVGDRERIFIPLTLRRGRNTVTVKLWNRRGSWGFGLRPVARDGALLYPAVEPSSAGH